jgi:Fur family ferric uptake transcriptional regulator
LRPKCRRKPRGEVEEEVEIARKRSSPSTIERACKGSGLRMTAPRRLIARVLSEAGDHPDVVELHRRVSAHDARIALSTVYRTVRLLMEHGILERHAFGDGRARYEHAPREHHDHLIDLTDGKVMEFQSDEIERLQAEIARKLGYRIVSHRLELYAVPLDAPWDEAGGSLPAGGAAIPKRDEPK